jgi:hypothetical protein
LTTEWKCQSYRVLMWRGGARGSVRCNRCAVFPQMRKDRVCLWRLGVKFADEMEFVRDQA